MFASNTFTPVNGSEGHLLASSTPALPSPPTATSIARGGFRTRLGNNVAIFVQTASGYCDLLSSQTGLACESLNPEDA